jgi:hypothetical protein
VSWDLTGFADLDVTVFRSWRADVIQKNVGGGQAEPAAKHDTGERGSAKSGGQSYGSHTRDSVSFAPPP